MILNKKKKVNFIYLLQITDSLEDARVDKEHDTTVGYDYATEHIRRERKNECMATG